MTRCGDNPRHISPTCCNDVSRYTFALTVHMIRRPWFRSRHSSLIVYGPNGTSPKKRATLLDAYSSSDRFDYRISPQSFMECSLFMSQTCPECNHEYADGDVFCSSCGTRFGDERATSREVSAGSGSARSSQRRALGDSQEDSDGFIPLPLPPEPPVRFWQSRGRNGVATRWWVVVLSLVLVLLIAGAILGAWQRADDGDGNSGDTGIVSGAQGVVIPTLNLMDTSTPTLQPVKRPPPHRRQSRARRSRQSTAMRMAARLQPGLKRPAKPRCSRMEPQGLLS